MQLRRAALRRRTRIAGASLIEVLVSIVIASIGLLALAGINASSMRYTKLSQYRATAAQLATDLGERMRANRAGFVAGNYDYSATFAAQGSAAITAPGNMCTNAAAPCTAAQIASVDMYQWRLAARDNLPQGSVFMIRDATPAAGDLWVIWMDPSVSATDDRPASASECPDDLERSGNLAIRCMFFRVNL